MSVELDKGKLHRLDEMEAQFVSLVRAGANRQTKFMVVKQDDEEEVEKLEDVESTESASNPDESKDSAKEADFLDMLNTAFDQVEAMNVDLKIDAALSEVAAPTAQVKASTENAEVSKESDACSDDKEGEKIAKALSVENAALKKEAQKLRDELLKNQNTVERLKSSIGKSTALAYGEVGSSPFASAAESKPRGLWGRDLATEVAETKSS